MEDDAQGRLDGIGLRETPTEGWGGELEAVMGARQRRMSGVEAWKRALKGSTKAPRQEGLETKTAAQSHEAIMMTAESTMAESVTEVGQRAAVDSGSE